MIALDLPSARRLAFMCARGQMVVTVLVAVASLAVAGPRAGWSAVVGGGASALASLAMALLAFGRLSGSSAERMLLAFLVGELAKIVVVIAVLVLALAFMKVNPVALISAYVATFLVYWVVLARALLPREMVR
ncbi:MAG TPA: ATP synthase subunit I [Steroidobacteraceae bacterium]|nr:ATP synthase subunit I [Steroidobacteraceae bacterium]